MGLSPACAPALVRLLGGDALEELEFYCHNNVLLDEPAAALLGAALRANTTLTHLRLDNALNQNEAAVVLLLRALEAHPTLRKLELTNNSFHHVGRAACEALGALVAANAPALHELDLGGSLLYEGFGPLVFALGANTHLRVLDCHDCGMNTTFAEDYLLTALRENTGLRRFNIVDSFMVKAEALVAARGGGAV